MAKIVTITNPLTGQPAQVDQLDHTAQQIDDGLNIARNVSNPNLLDNWYFGNPVDQRQGRVVVPNTTYYSDNTLTTSAGTTSAYVTAYRYATGTANGVNYASFKLEDSNTAPTYYAAPENVVRGYVKTFEDGTLYTIDRWMLTGLDATGATHLLVNDDSVTYEGAGNSNLSEIVNCKLSGKTVTGSVLCEAVTNCMMMLRNTHTWEPIGSVVMDTPGMHSFTATIPDNYDLDTVRLTFSAGSQGEGVAHSISIKAAKLELGSQQTLAHQENGVWQLNEIPDYGEQLRRCQRYFCRMYCKCPPKNSSAASENQNGGFISFPVTMRTNPTGSLISKEVSTISLGETTVNGFDVGGADNYSRSFVADFTADL